MPKDLRGTDIRNRQKRYWSNICPTIWNVGQDFGGEVRGGSLAYALFSFHNTPVFTNTPVFIHYTVCKPLAVLHKHP